MSALVGSLAAPKGLERWVVAGRRLARRDLAIAAAVANGALAVAGIALHLLNGTTDLTTWWWSNPTIGVIAGVCGLLITANQPANVIGWLLAIAGIGESLCGAGRELGVFLLLRDIRGADWVVAAFDPLWVLGFALLPLTLMLFPNGRPLTRRWRWGVALGVVAGAVTWFAATFYVGGGVIDGHPISNPVGILDPLGQRIAMDAATWISIAALVVAVAAIVVRHHRSTFDERRQLRWLVFAGTANAFELATELLPFNTWEIYTGPISVALFGTALVVAITRHRLFDIDVILNRSAVFLALSLGVAAGYLGVVAVFGETTDDRYDLASSLLAALAVAFAIAPARQVLQRAIDRAMYGSRGDPYRALSRLSGRISDTALPGAELQVLAETFGQTLKLAHVRIEDGAGHELASVGTPRGELFGVDLAFLGRPMGRLVVGPPSGHRHLGPAEQRLVTDMAAQMGPAIHAVRLGTDLQASRQRLVTAKEEERRRLRRDLHDGLGPKLAAIRLRLDTTTGILDDRPVDARHALEEVTGYLKEAIADVRGLVYGLRPPALDELGLVSALADLARQAEDRAARPLRVTVTPSGDLEDLPAAVEVAAYWIVTEALTNVTRHARASSAAVGVDRQDGEVTITIVDDGVGVPAARRNGVGTASMGERAAELGGTCTVAAEPGRGTQVVARLPLPLPTP